MLTEAPLTADTARTRPRPHAPADRTRPDRPPGVVPHAVPPVQAPARRPPRRRPVPHPTPSARTGSRAGTPLPAVHLPSFSVSTAAPASLVGTDPVWHLLRRTTYGPTPQLVASVKASGTAAWIDAQLAPATIDDSACTAYLARYPTVAMTTPQLDASLERYSWDAMFELGRATVARAVFSRRQLLEVMVEFWSNHFNVTTPSGEVWDTKTVDDRAVARRYAFGRFSDMLIASATSPSMLQYLDNAYSYADAPNENYGRELLELHTVGVGAGYTQDDVVNSARILTGLTVGRHNEFAYHSDDHYVGPVRVLGFSAANADAFNGVALAKKYLTYLAKHPATAKHVVTKLVTHFVSDTPPDALVTRLVQVYLAQGTAIAPVLRALLTSPEFAASDGQKVRRPIEDVVGSLRTLGVTPAAGGADSFGSIYWTLWNLGQAPLAWHPPNGYPDVAAAWLSTSGTLGRWNAHEGVAGRWWDDGFTITAATGLLGTPAPATCGAVVDALTARLVGVRFSDAHRAALLTFLHATASTPWNGNVNWRLNDLVALVLNSPYWMQR